jgi:hypothetical protein
MPRIAMSATYPLAANVGAVYGAAGGGVYGASNTSFIPNPSGTTHYPRPYLALCKGAVPTSHPSPYTARSADFLAFWSDPGNVAGTMFASSTNVNDVTTLITQPAAASASGLATWFWYWSGSSFGYDPAVNQSTIGTVGLPGSGADLVLGDTNIIAGLLYKMIIPIKWPSAWNF